MATVLHNKRFEYYKASAEIMCFSAIQELAENYAPLITPSNIKQLSENFNIRYREFIERLTKMGLDDWTELYCGWVEGDLFIRIVCYKHKDKYIRLYICIGNNENEEFKSIEEYDDDRYAS